MKYEIGDTFIIEGSKMKIYRMDEDHKCYFLIDSKGVFRLYSEEFLLNSNLVKKI